MPLPTVPGVTIEEISTLGPSVAAVATAIPAFIGYTEKGPKTPTRIKSFDEFVTIFGGANPLEVASASVTITDIKKTILGTDIVSRVIEAKLLSGAALTKIQSNSLYYSLVQFYSNGGGVCYITSVGNYNAPVAKGDLLDGLAATGKVDEPTLLIFPDAYSLTGTNYGDVVNAALQQCARLQDRFSIFDVNKETNISILAQVTTFRGYFTLGSEQLRYGAVYGPALETSLSYAINADSIKIVHKVFNPDGVTPATTAKVYDDKVVSYVLTGDTSASNANANPGLYSNILAELAKFNLTVPASGAVAGVYASTDANRGVWKAPANAGLVGVIKPAVALTDTQQSVLNVDATSGKAINAIRSFTGKGTLIWGARTLDANSLEWRYINVRRLFIFVEESVKKAMENYVFEPNTAQTWVSLKGTIDNFLTELWRQGALAGAKSDDAYTVKIGLGSTMSSNDILEGRLNIEIGLAAARPAEFIILKFSQKQQVS